ncbi:multidrug MFS transporter [Lactobacillus sp. CBA3605]|uniref:sugar transferase n=1 Tax=Lactobacillus sp. CBA3605 TaxID=2099788 RepID=UPI000CFB56D8|nr:sugar transferase [Lactobacillus sp. CBA3605]AVK60729.1 multidrug MFS transporter [Lactobacillus sp. CBA3605]
MEYNENNLKSITVDQVYQQHRYGYHLIKRCFDFVASLIGLIILSPLLLIVAISIKLEDPRGRVIYSQTRLGKDKVPFRMYKFRSMVSNADELLQSLLVKNEIGGAMFKMKDDPRITKVGKFIRKYSIDELPQLVNVLVGNMSLVGPRPPLPREVDEYTEYDKQRLIVKPGCTGLWQATARNSVGFDEMVYLDLRYIQKCNFLFDFRILIMTVVVFLRPNGAY